MTIMDDAEAKNHLIQSCSVLVTFRLWSSIIAPAAVPQTEERVQLHCSTFLFFLLLLLDNLNILFHTNIKYLICIGLFFAF